MASSKLCSIEKIIFKALVDFYSSYEELLLVINEKQNYFRAEYDQLRDHERDISVKYELDRVRDKVQKSRLISRQKCKINWNDRQCYHIGWNAEKIQRVKTQKSQRLKIGKSCYCPGPSLSKIFGLLSLLKIRIPLSRSHLSSDILF